MTASKSSVQPAAGSEGSVNACLRSGLFMITCAARTGSTMLVNLLQSHGDLLCHMEIFNPARVEAFSGTLRERLAAEEGLEARLRELRKYEPEQFLYKFAFDAQGRKGVGFKFKYEELLLPAFARARAVLLQDTDIKIIHLRRRNLLERYLSWWIVNNVTHVTMIREGETRPVVPPVRLDPAACRADLERVGRLGNFVGGMFRHHQVLDIYYEDLIGAESEKHHKRLLDFLELPRRPLHTVLGKLAEAPLQERIENFSEIRRALAGTPYEKLCNE